MLLTLIALQAATLDADPAQAALACAHAVVESGGVPGNPLRFSSQYHYFLMSSAAAAPSEKGAMARLEALAAAEAALPAIGPETAAKLLLACDTRYPLARSTAPAPLPTSDFRRDSLCTATLGMAIGGAEGAGGSAKDAARLREVLNAYTTRISDVRLALEGYDTDAKVDALFDRELETSVKSGNIETIVAACARVIGK